MKLGSLIYEVVRDAIEFPSGFNKIGFIRGDYDNDRDFSSQISFAFNYVNLAFTRLSTEGKTLLMTTLKTSDASGYVGVTEGEVISVVQGSLRRYNRVHFRSFENGIAVEPDYVGKELIVEYRPFIPRFDINSIRKEIIDEDKRVTNEEVEIELKDYGVTDDMCSYVKEYAKGGLMEYLSPDLSSKHMQMAESYFRSLKTRYTDFPQMEVEDRFFGGGAF